jgi:hypothetical protein
VHQANQYLLRRRELAKNDCKCSLALREENVSAGRRWTIRNSHRKYYLDRTRHNERAEGDHAFSLRSVLQLPRLWLRD